MAITSEIDQKNAKDPSIAKANIITAPLQRIMHQTGIELGSVPWQGTILPLDQWCFDEQTRPHL